MISKAFCQRANTFSDSSQPTPTAPKLIGSVPFGIALLGAFALGRSVPIILGAVGVGWLESLNVFARWQKAFEIIGALTLIISGVYLIQQYYEMPM